MNAESLNQRVAELEAENKHLRGVIYCAIPWLGLAIARNIHADAAMPEHLVGTLEAAEAVAYPERKQGVIAAADAAP